MSLIKIRCTDQVMTFENTPVIAAGGMEENQVQFDLCSQWDGYAVTAVFWRSPDKAYHAVLDEYYTCVIPWEVLATEGLLYFGIFGVNEAQHRRTSEVVNYHIVAGAITEGTQPSEPTPEIYDQLLAQYASKADRVLGATAGNFATLDALGNLQDSGKNPQSYVYFANTAEEPESGPVLWYNSEGRLIYKDAEGTKYSLKPATTIAQVLNLVATLAAKADLDASGKVKADQLPSLSVAVTAEVTLPAASWAEGADGLYYQTAAVAAATANNVAIVSAAPASMDGYTVAQVRCTAQAAGSLTFGCKKVPDAALVANVVFLEVKDV